MPRTARQIASDHAYHITQRGNYKQPIFDSDEDYLTYLTLLEYYSQQYGLNILSYCLMPNHIHLAAIPSLETSLASTIKLCHQRYSRYFNRKKDRTGHLWQGRYYSCLMDNCHLFAAIRYIETNPFRGKLVTSPFKWPWSSANDHLNKTTSYLSLYDINKVMTVRDWNQYLMNGSEEMDEKIRAHTRSGKALVTDTSVCHQRGN